MNPVHLAAIAEAVSSIPRGQTRSYGAVARMAGLPGRARLVGTALGRLHDEVPWHRVVNAQGKLSTTGEAANEQRARLQDEGVGIDPKGRVVHAESPDFLLPESPNG